MIYAGNEFNYEIAIIVGGIHEIYAITHKDRLLSSVILIDLYWQIYTDK